MSECADKSYFDDDYTMNHYKCLRIHFETKVTELRDPNYPVDKSNHNAASISNPKTVPFSYGSRSVRVRLNDDGAKVTKG